MANERLTENLVRNHLDKLGYKNDPSIIIEEQSSKNPKINKLLKSASKSGDGAGYPEFIIRSTKYPHLLLVIECKASPKFHESKTKDQYAKYAVDGALLYASYLSKEFDVIAIGISGQIENEMNISHYLNLKGEDVSYDIFSNNFMSFENYYNGYIKSEHKFNQDYSTLLSYSKDLNDLFHSKKIKESQRSLLISSILISIENKAFKSSYNLHTDALKIVELMLSTVKTELESSKIPKDKIQNIVHAYSFITHHPSLSKDRDFVVELIESIDKNVNSFMKTYQYFDTIGQFYIEFLRYANSDKGLGIVLTPPHITKLFCDLAEVNQDSVVLDNCCGTGGFLISAMQSMISQAKGDKDKENHIKNNQIVGIEFQDDIYALAVSNMILHGDGKSNIIQGDCFHSIESIRNQFKPTVALLNPPYKNTENDPKELEFALNALDMLENNGKCVIILPMSCALAQSGVGLELKSRILKKHTLEAVVSMPDQLFHNSKVGVVTCVMVFSAHRPHPENKKTWFGYWKDDGFVKVKNKGRIDSKNQWDIIKKRWLEAFHNRDDVPGESVKQKVTAEDEWCAEAYMETDYSTLTHLNFEIGVREFFSFQVLTRKLKEKDVSIRIKNQLNLNVSGWKPFRIGNLFQIEQTKGKTTNDLLIGNDVPYIGAKKDNNGLENMCSIKGNERFISKGNCIVFIQLGQGSAGYSTYQNDDFIGMNGKTSCGYNKNLNKYIGIFIVAVLDLERPKYSFGRSWTGDRLKNTIINLPAKKQHTEAEDWIPDWKFMEEFINSLHYSDYIT